MIVTFLAQDHSDWDVHVKEFRFAFNTFTHSSTKYSRVFLKFGREPLVANTVKQFISKDTHIEPRDWAKRLGRVRAIRGYVAENLKLTHNMQAKIWNQ